MALRFFQGPDHEPIQITVGRAARGPRGVPFHGIASRGLLPWLRHQPDGPALWQRAAHMLEAPADADLAPDELALRGAARRAGALTFSQSALAAARHVGSDDGELWAVKEGHTSSVWLADVAGVRYVVNVARDRAASAELRDSSLRLKALAAERPDLALARVLAVTTDDLRDLGGPPGVTVTRNALIEDALEIHRLPTEDGYAFVERFLPGGAEAPARIHAVRGRRATDDERRRIDAVIEAVCAASSDDLPVAVEVDDGDLVWDGARAVVVAIS